MGDFKKLLMNSLETFLRDFQSKKADISDDYVLELTKKGSERARSNAREVLEEMEEAMVMLYL
jgi:hypothetical protein